MARPISWAMTSLLCAVLVACADDDTGRRFANDPVPSEDVLATRTVPIDVAATTAPTSFAASPVPVAELLHSPDGDPIVVIETGGSVVALGPPWIAPRPIWDEQKGRVSATALSADGSLVALLVASDASEGQVDLVVVSVDGQTVQRVSDLNGATGAVDHTGDAPGTDSLDWSSDGSTILAGLATGGVVAVPFAGEPQVLIEPARAPAPAHVAWSPRGDAIAYVLAPSTEVAGGLYVAPTGALPLDPVRIVAPSGDQRRTVSTFSWMPDGASLLYTMSSTTGDPLLGGDVFRVPAAGGAPTLVAGASRVAQVAAVSRFALSPDGAGLAYVVTAPDENGDPSDTLWLRPLGGSETMQLPVGRGERVANIWWTADGLVWETFPIIGKDDDSLTLYRARSGEAPGLVYAGPATPATPQASPAATPITSPVASTPAS